VGVECQKWHREFEDVWTPVVAITPVDPGHLKEDLMATRVEELVFENR
jgi:hypothetical protein